MSAFVEASALRRETRKLPDSLRGGCPRTAAVILILLAAYGSWQVCRWPSANRPLIGDLWFGVFALVQTVAAWSASRRCRDHRTLRSAWRLLAFGSGAYLAGQIAWTVYELEGRKPYPSVADGFSLLFYPLTLWGLLRFPSPPRDLAQRIRLSLDLALVAIGGSVVVLYVVLGPTIEQGGSNAFQSAFSIAYPVGDMVLLMGVASVVLRRTTVSSTVALRFMAVSLLFFVAADVLYGYITLNSTYVGGSPPDTVYIVAMAMFAVSAAAQSRPNAALEPFAEEQRGRASWAPYVAVAVGFGVLLLNDRNVALLPDASLVFAAVLLATLVSVRQFLAQKDLLNTQGRLSHQSLHDALTGLPNRVLVIDRAEQMLARARRIHSPGAALYVDLDGFKHVNDSFGHAAGDELLRVVAARLSSIVREADTVGRLGGDEFVVLLENPTLEASAELAAERICEVISQPIDVQGANGRTMSVTASIGISLGDRASADDCSETLTSHSTKPKPLARTAGSCSSRGCTTRRKAVSSSRWTSNKRSKTANSSSCTNRRSISNARRSRESRH